MLLRIEPLDPLMPRDGRPFDATPGVSARSMDGVSPGMLSGSLRTWLYKRLGSLPEGTTSDILKRVRIAGPLLEWKGHIYYPMPADRIFYEQKGCPRTERLRPEPLRHGEGYFGMKVEGSRRMELEPPIVNFHGKPYFDSPAYVREDWMFRELLNDLSDEEWEHELQRWRNWLRGEAKEQAGKKHDEAAPINSPFLQPFVKEQRIHNAIEGSTGNTLEGALFSTEALRYRQGVSLVVSLDMEDYEFPITFKGLHSMGGKRRLSSFQELDWPNEQLSPWQCPDQLAERLRGAVTGSLLRMTLVTPAYFLKGWRPRWIDADSITNQNLFANWYPDDMKLPNLRLRLRWACVNRAQPISGWSYSRTAEEGREKPVRRMVPAGSVYIFEILEGNAGILAEHWLASVSDTRRRKGPLDREDGFGLAMWGIE
ncbi:type III-B CRISPR module-associated protein Cmr3 [Paenibacillus glufosinatiresistens]|uniref:type III-B CRISPR module-associated protein Cmr3 n=1 Tax=Paenibacillus glufosinatiresistens TaxID=3070657 RepID=UPI00286DF57E|nr:type III-B CRISPR module-associated protein Cmr3 [Paenibacillus sp. YX.27]